MRNNHSIEQAFIEAVNNYIAAVNEDMIAYGLEESAFWPFVSPIGEAYADHELVHRLQAYQFPDVLDEAVVAAGGEEYKTYYKFIFPINIEEVLN